MYKYLFFLSFGLVACNFIAHTSQTSSNPILHSPELLKKDILDLKNELEKYHAGLYRYTPKSQLDSSFTSLINSIRQPMSTLAFYRKLSPLIAQIKCGHTTIQLPEILKDSLYEKENLLPFEGKIIDNEFFITKNLSKNINLEIGSKIISINKTSLQKLIPYMLQQISALSDGENQSGKKSYLAKNFARLYPLLVPSQSKDYLIEYQEITKKNIQKIKIKGIQLQAWLRQANEQKDAHHQVLKLDILNNFHTAILRSKTFDKGILQQNKIDFSAFLDSTFQLIQQQKINNLILDLRDNTGGNDEFAAELLSYLMPKPFKMYDRIEVSSAYQGYGKIERVANNKYLNIKHIGLYFQNSKPLHFQGKVYILANGGTFSASTELIALAQYHQIAEVIGEETGGAYTGNTSGIIRQFILKSSGLKIRIPQWSYYLAVQPHSRRGILPDYVIKTEPSDLQSQIDKPMRKAFELIGKIE